NVSWSSDNTSVATVNSSGLVEAVAPGTATITVTTADGSHTAASAITVLPAGNNNFKNYEFDEGTSNWVLYNWASGGGAAFSVVQGQDMSGTNAAHLQIDNTDNSGWKIQFNQHLDFM